MYIHVPYMSKRWVIITTFKAFEILMYNKGATNQFLPQTCISSKLIPPVEYNFNPG